MLRSLPILASALALFVVAACSPVPSTGGVTELKLWKHQAGEGEEAANKAAIDRFNASQSIWHVTAQSIPQGNYSQSVVAASLAGQMPCILTVDQPMVASFVWAGHLQPIDGKVPSELLATISPTALGQYGDHIYSAGQFDAALALFTRRSVLAKIGARVPTIDKPWHQEEFDAVLERLKSTGGYRYPLDLATRDLKADWWTYAFSPMLQSMGGDLVDRQSKMSAEGVLNGPDGQRFGRWFQSLFVRGLVNQREPDENAFQTGRAAMSYTGNWWEQGYRKAFGDDLLILPPPDFGHGPVIGGGSWQWAISKTCPNSDGAAAFITFMLRPSEIARMSDATGLVPVSEAGAAQSKNFRLGGQSRIFFELMRRFARSRPATPAFSVVSNAFMGAMRDAMEGKDVKDALDDAVDDIDGTLADNPSYRTSGNAPTKHTVHP